MVRPVKSGANSDSWKLGNIDSLRICDPLVVLTRVNAVAQTVKWLKIVGTEARVVEYICLFGLKLATERIVQISWLHSEQIGS